MQKRIDREYYLLVALLYGGVNAPAAVYTTYLLMHGLSQADVFLVRLVYFGTLVLLEFYAGVLSDWLGRRALVIAACTLFIANMVMFGSFQTFWPFVFAEFVGAVGQTCANRACEAWYVDRSNHYSGGSDEHTFFHRRFSSAWVLKHLMSLFAGAVGGYLSYQWAPAAWFFGALFFSGGLVFAVVSMREEYFVRSRISFCDAHKIFLARAQQSFKLGWNNPDVMFLSVVMFGLAASVMSANLLWQPYFRQWAGNDAAQGLIWGGMSASLMLGSFLAPTLMWGVACERKCLLACAAIVAVGMGTTVYLDFPTAFAAFFPYQAARGSVGVIKDSLLARSIKGAEQRAAIASFESIAYHGGGFVVLIVWGVFVRDVSIQTAWTVSAIGLVSLVVVMAFTLPHMFKENRNLRKPLLTPLRVGIIVVAILFGIGLLMPSNHTVAPPAAMYMQSPPPPIGASAFPKNP